MYLFLYSELNNEGMKVEVQRTFKSYFLSPKKQQESRNFPEICMKFFSDICMKYLNPQVRINKMLNEHNVYYHRTPSESTSRIDPLIFIWTPKGFVFSPQYFLNFFSNLYIAPWLQKSFKLMVLRLLEIVFVSQKIKPVRFYLCPQTEISPKFL